VFELLFFMKSVKKFTK